MLGCQQGVACRQPARQCRVAGGTCRCFRAVAGTGTAINRQTDQRDIQLPANRFAVCCPVSCRIMQPVVDVYGSEFTGQGVTKFRECMQQYMGVDTTAEGHPVVRGSGK